MIREDLADGSKDQTDGDHALLAIQDLKLACAVCNLQRKRVQLSKVIHPKLAAEHTNAGMR